MELVIATIEDLDNQRPYIKLPNGKLKRNPQYYRNLKKFWIKVLGGKCQNPDCACPTGYSRYFGALSFHHENKDRDKRVKKEWRNRKWDYSGVILLCANCHRERHKDEHDYGN